MEIDMYRSPRPWKTPVQCLPWTESHSTDLHTYTDPNTGAQILMAGPLLLTRPYSGHFLLLCLGGSGHEPDSDLDLSALPPGKSALHWAAAVNNVEATLALLKNGANKDMQDSKVSPSPWLTRESSLAQTSSYQVAESGVE